jgi:hypothetical protein
MIFRRFALLRTLRRGLDWPLEKWIVRVVHVRPILALHPTRIMLWFLGFVRHYRPSLGKFRLANHIKATTPTARNTNPVN